MQRVARSNFSLFSTAVIAATAFGLAPVAQAQSFSDVTAQSGVSFERVPSADYAISQAVQQDSLIAPFNMMNMPFTPMGARGMPGVGIADFDNDGDLDFLVTNGPGASNGYYVNQLSETGTMTFVDMADDAGIGAPDMDGNGTCFGDIENDGDQDVLILGRGEPNRLFENNGDGTFIEIESSGLDADLRSHISCSMGDVDGDGLLDITVSNTFDLSSLLVIFAVPFDLTHHNQLYLNNGDSTFTDVSASSGIESMGDLPPGKAGISWAVSMVDIDVDGDIDIVYADDQGGMPTTKVDPVNGVDRGFMQVLLNDGSGHFTADAQFHRPESPGSWMGVGFGDLDCDGSMDMYGSNFGDYHMPTLGLPYEFGDQASRWYLGDGTGGFSEGVPVTSTAFGWGNAVADYDNDGDSDVVYHGGLEMTVIGLRDNPGVYLENPGCGSYAPITHADKFGSRHVARNVHGMAIGDLDRDGFVDIVTAANWAVNPPMPLLPAPAQYGGVLDAFAFFAPIFAPVGPGQMVWTGLEFGNGDVIVERNDGNGNGGVTIRPVGSVDITDDGANNRSGIGAVVTFTPDGGSTAMMPVTGGSSHTSAHANEAYFGLGSASSGQLDVAWPGGVKNRVYGVDAGENLTMPEIPCSYDGDGRKGRYIACVARSLADLRRADVIDGREGVRLLLSAIRAWNDEH